jgi:anti-sigma B factor antagonist
MDKPLETTVRQVAGVAVIDLRGDIDGSSEPALNAAYAEASANGSTSVLLNFSGVGYINSTGIALIVGVLAQARKARRPVSTCGLSEHYTEIFQITRLADFMGIYPDEASALSHTAR